MTDISEREACTKRCWWMGAGAGLLVAFLLLAFGIWGLLMSIVAGVLVAVIVIDIAFLQFAYISFFCLLAGLATLHLVYIILTNKCARECPELFA